MSRTSRHLLLGLSVVGLGLGTQSCLSDPYTAKATENATVDYVPATPIHVTTRNGSIQVIGGADGDSISIQATIVACGASQEEAEDRLDRVRLRYDRDDQDRLVVKADFGSWQRGRDGVSYVIHVPDSDGAHLRTSNGTIRVQEITGDLDADTSNGRITVNDHSGTARLVTSNGAVSADDIEGPVVIRTSNGGVDLKLRPESSGPVNVHTSNGPVNLTVGREFQGALGLRTSNGRVWLKNRAGLELRSNLRKRSGTIRFSADGKDSKVRTSNGSLTVTVQ